MRFNTFVNRTVSYSVRQLALEIAAVRKFAYRDQLICLSSKQERISAIMCELQRKFAQCSELKSTHESELKRLEMNGIRTHANNYETGNLDKRTNAKYSAPKFSYSPVGRMSDFITVPTLNHSFEMIRAGAFSSDYCPIGA